MIKIKNAIFFEKMAFFIRPGPAYNNTMAQKIIITASQKKFFEDEGYLLIEKVLDDSDLRDVISEITEEIEARARKLYAGGGFIAVV